jgi:hypothetical protein
VKSVGDSVHDTVSQHERLIENLFQGEKSDYVCCLECGNVTNTDAVLFRISKIVHAFPSDGPARTSTDGPDAVMDVREALRQILTPEQLRDREQYHCAHCKCWTSAERGMLGMQTSGSLYRRSSLSHSQNVRIASASPQQPCFLSFTSSHPPPPFPPTMVTCMRAALLSTSQA